jgi:osmotically-inducible protein OsmY
MDDRSRRDARNRSDQDRDQFRGGGDSYVSRQAEQFDEGGSWEQDRSISPDSRYSGGMRDWRAASPRDGRDNFGWAAGYAARDAGFGDDYYDNGLGSREETRSRSGRPGTGDFGGHKQSDRDRGLLERAGDEVASWFGDVDAARRREEDHRGKGPSNYKRTDERILEDVCDCLTEDRRVDARNIQVTIKDGEVTLDGTVDSREAKRRAEDIVDDISGVGHVQNNLRVTGSAARPGSPAEG